MRLSHGLMYSCMAALLLLTACGGSRQATTGYDRSEGRKTAARAAKGAATDDAEARLRQEMVDYARRYVGKRYKYAARGPNAFDCSGFTCYVYNNFDLPLSPSSRVQATEGERIPMSEVQPGDLIFFKNTTKRKGISHVAMVVSNEGKEGVVVIHSTTSRGVMVQNIHKSSYWRPKIAFARRVILTETLPPLPDVEPVAMPEKIVDIPTSVGDEVDVMRSRIADMARQQIGKSYAYSGSGPDDFASWGLAFYLYHEQGIALPEDSAGQARSGKKIELKEARPGDLVFFKSSDASRRHVAVVVRNDREGVTVVHSTSSKGVIEQNISKSGYWLPRVAFVRSVL